MMSGWWESTPRSVYCDELLVITGKGWMTRTNALILLSIPQIAALPWQLELDEQQETHSDEISFIITMTK